MFESRLDEIEAEYRSLLRGNEPSAPPLSTASDVQRIIRSMDVRGAWVEPGRLRHHKIEPPGGIISSTIFAENMQKLSAYLVAKKPPR